MNIYALLLGIFLCTGMTSILALIVCRSLERINRYNKIQSESDLMDILNRAIEREFRYKVDFEFKIKRVKSVGNFEKEVNDLVHSTIKSLSGNILDDLEYYYSLENITEMVFKAHSILLTAYMDKSNSEPKDYIEKRITK